jgi:hypothetical protein
MFYSGVPTIFFFVKSFLDNTGTLANTCTAWDKEKVVRIFSFKQRLPDGNK